MKEFGEIGDADLCERSHETALLLPAQNTYT